MRKIQMTRFTKRDTVAEDLERAPPKLPDTRA